MKNVKKVFLIGYMGVGKTTLGKRLANALDLPFFDLDREIVKMESRPIKEIFAESGELFFRELESRLLKDFCNRKESFVLSTGGGTAAAMRNVEAMKESGTVVWLDIPLEKLISRLAQSNDRPLLEKVPTDERKDFIKAHFAERLPHYKEAHIRFEASDVNAEKLKQLAEEIHSR